MADQYLDKPGLAHLWGKVDEKKQDKLTAGEGVTISGNTISATGGVKLIVSDIDPGEGSPLEPGTIYGVY